MSSDDQLETLVAFAESIEGIKKMSSQSNIDKAANYIPVLIEKMNSKDFYQWFCPVWQACEFLYSDASVPDWNSYLVIPFSKSLLETGISKPTLRAMCISYMLTSLSIPKESQAIALRMLFLFATNSNLASNQSFVSWILRFMKGHITDMFKIEKERALFIEICIDFFSEIQTYDIVCLKPLITFISNRFVSNFVNKSKTSQNGENIIQKMGKISQHALFSAFNYHISNDLSEDRLVDENIFIFEVFFNCSNLADFLDKKSLQLLEIFVRGTYKDFKQFCNDPENKKFIDDNKLSMPNMIDKIQILTFTSLAANKSTLTFDEICQEFEFNLSEMRRLIVNVNSTLTAVVKIDGVNQKVSIENCQPRIFSEDKWTEMNQQLQNLVKSINPATQSHK